MILCPWRWRMLLLLLLLWRLHLVLKAGRRRICLWSR